MHEVSLVRSLLRQVEALAEQHYAKTILEIEVEIGPLSGVEPLLLRDAFDVCSPGTQCEEASLVIREVPLKALCRNCSRESELEGFCFRCSHCDSRSLTMTQGEEFRLLNVTMQIDGLRETNDEIRCEA